MNASPGNVRVKKAVREELNKAATDGFPQEMIDEYVATQVSQDVFSSYNASTIASELGQSEYHFHDYTMANKLVDKFKNIKPDDLKRIASKYFSEEKIQVINIKPEY